MYSEKKGYWFLWKVIEDVIEIHWNFSKLISWTSDVTDGDWLAKIVNIVKISWSNNIACVKLVDFFILPVKADDNSYNS